MAAGYTAAAGPPTCEPVRRAPLLLGLLVVIGALVAACRVASADPYVEVLDSLEVPAGWELAHERVREPFGTNPCGPGLLDCPAAHRYYYITGEPSQAYPPAKALLVDAGFEVADEYVPCDPPRSSAFSCGLNATKSAIIVTVYVYEPGRDVEKLGIAREGVSIVELRAYGNSEAEGEP